MKRSNTDPSPSLPKGEGAKPNYHTTDGQMWNLLHDKALAMRKSPTIAEAALWESLRRNATQYHFRRQHIIDRFIVDFVCLDKLLVVEADGDIHDYQQKEDEERTSVLVKHGFTVIRFRNEEIIADVDTVVKKICTQLEALKPSPLGGEKERGDLSILYEDNHIIAINKLPSEIVQGDKTGDEPLSEKVKEYLRKTYNKPGEAYLGVAHRIDRPVSGVVIFAKTSKALSRLNEMFRDKQIKKTYWAVVKNKPNPESAHLVHYLIKNEQKNMSRAYEKEVNNALKAELDYKIIFSSDNYHLLEINPLTGRHHQIRVQLSAIGCPIKGDFKYGFKRGNEDASIHLHSRRSEFIHPVSKEPVTIVADPPNEVLWNFFKAKL